MLDEAPIDMGLSEREAEAAEEHGPIACTLLPTSARPGSDEKILVLAARYAARMELWNPHDTPSIEKHETPTFLTQQFTPDDPFADEDDLDEN